MDDPNAFLSRRLPGRRFWTGDAAVLIEAVAALERAAQRVEEGAERNAIHPDTVPFPDPNTLLEASERLSAVNDRIGRVLALPGARGTDTKGGA